MSRLTVWLRGVQAALMYSEAQCLIDDASQTGPVALGLRVLMALARVLRQRRLDSGALLLASTEVCRFYFNLVLLNGGALEK